jgi:hypothetical protein
LRRYHFYLDTFKNLIYIEFNKSKEGKTMKGYTVRVLGMSAWKTGIATYGAALREKRLADRICQPGHRIIDESTGCIVEYEG